MRIRFLTLMLAAALPVALQAQSAAPAPDAAVGTMRELWKSVTDYITSAANEVPEAQYGYRPVETVRTFGQLIAHIAGAQNLMCSAALGDPPREEDEIERTKTSKADLVAALRASTEYCAKAYAQSDAQARQGTKLFGGDRTRLYALGLNATHNGEHYGNIITYLRMQGVVPPSSRRP